MLFQVTIDNIHAVFHILSLFSVCRFTTKEHKDFGHFVTQVKGVGADWDNDKTYWAFLKRTDDVDCSISMGESNLASSFSNRKTCLFMIIM